MFGMNAMGRRVWTFGGVDFVAAKGQYEMIRKGRWSFHYVKDVKGRRGSHWKNYALYFDPVGLNRRVRRTAWHVAYDGERFADSESMDSLRGYNPELLEFVATAVVNCAGAAEKIRLPLAPKERVVRRDHRRQNERRRIFVDLDARIEEQIDRQWRIGVPLTRKRGFADIFSFCEERLGAPREYTKYFLERKTRQRRVKYDAFKGGYMLVD